MIRKTDITERLSKELWLSWRFSRKVFDHLIGQVLEAIRRWDSVSIPKLGEFSTYVAPWKKVKNPKTGIVSSGKHYKRIRFKVYAALQREVKDLYSNPTNHGTTATGLPDDGSQ